VEIDTFGNIYIAAGTFDGENAILIFKPIYE
jgi:hypothetical protein